MDQVGGEVREEINSAVRVSMLEGDVLSLDVSELAKALLKGRPIGGRRRRSVSRTGDDKIPYSVDLPSRLPLGGARRGEEATSQATDERPSVHHSIT
jgi:hypothetical protein